LLAVESRHVFLREVAQRLGGIKRSTTNGDLSAAVLSGLGTTPRSSGATAQPQKEVSMTRCKYKVFDRHGHVVEEDDGVCARR
jgi:hypothetical protein